MSSRQQPRPVCIADVCRRVAVHQNRIRQLAWCNGTQFIVALHDLCSRRSGHAQHFGGGNS